MMNKSTKLERFLDFLAGRGFYIILGLCVVAIGISGYVLLFGGDSGEENPLVMAYSPTPPAITAPSPTPRVTQPPVAVNPPTETVPVIRPNPVIPSIPPLPVPSQTAAPAPSKTPAEEKPAPTAPVLTPEKPIFSRPINGVIVQPYSMDNLIKHETLNVWRVHDGMDITAVAGTVVCAAGDGTVVDIFEDPTYGLSVKISHSEGLCSVYSNLDPALNATLNQFVKMGEAIGKTGITAVGEAGEDGHLHFAMLLNDEPVDPLDYLPE